MTLDKRPTVPCKWCGTPTTMLGTKECDADWELRTRIERDPQMARKMLAELENSK